MFESTPDPAWHYAYLWEQMQKIVLEMKEVETKCSDSSAEDHSYDLDLFFVTKLQAIKNIAQETIDEFPMTEAISLIID